MNRISLRLMRALLTTGTWKQGIGIVGSIGGGWYRRRAS